MVADDSAAVRLVLKGLLEEAGVRVVQTVANGSEALNALRHHQPDLLCLDVNMPVMDGMEALPQAVEISPETVIVMVTGCNDRQQIAQAAGLAPKAISSSRCGQPTSKAWCASCSGRPRPDLAAGKFSFPGRRPEVATPLSPWRVSAQNVRTRQ